MNERLQNTTCYAPLSLHVHKSFISRVHWHVHKSSSPEEENKGDTSRVRYRCATPAPLSLRVSFANAGQLAVDGPEADRRTHEESRQERLRRRAGPVRRRPARDPQADEEGQLRALLGVLLVRRGVRLGQ